MRGLLSMVSSGWSALRRLLAVVASRRSLLVFTLVVLATDLFWILYLAVGKSLHELDVASVLYNHKELMITTDGGIPEWLTYLKTSLVVVLLVRLARSTRQFVYAALAFIFLVVVLDDAMEIHESLGLYFRRLLDIRPMLGLRARDFGELITWALLGLATVPLLLFGLARARPEHRANGMAFLLTFGALLFCAAFVDQLYHSYSDLFTLAGVLLDMLEDGGEMLAITAACALALGANRLYPPAGEPGS